MAKDDAPGAVSEGLRGEDVVLAALDQHLGPGQPCVHRPGDEKDRDVDVVHPGPEDRQHHDDEHQEREGHGDVEQAHHHGIEPPAVVSGGGAQHDAVDHRHVRGEESDLHVDADAVQDAAEDVPAEHVGPEGVGQAGRLEDAHEVLVIGVVRSQEGGEHARQDDHAHDPRADGERKRPLGELPADASDEDPLLFRAGHASILQHPPVDRDIGEIGHEIDDDHDHREHHRHPLDDGVVPKSDRAHE